MLREDCRRGRALKSSQRGVGAHQLGEEAFVRGAEVGEGDDVAAGRRTIASPPVVADRRSEDVRCACASAITRVGIGRA